MRYFKTICVYALALSFTVTCNYVSKIEDCPSLPPRTAPADSVFNLRPDDIKVVGALGDSIIAAAAAKGLRGSAHWDNVSSHEARGISFAVGGDPGAVTIPNILKKYSPQVNGASLSEHEIELCRFGLCSLEQYIPDLDVLNAAQSASFAMSLPTEVTYLVSKMKTLPGVDFENDWKLINVQIGALDLCYSCFLPLKGETSPETYSKHLDDMLSRVRAEVPRVIVNLINNWNISDVYMATHGHLYCKASMFGRFQYNQLQCPCSVGASNRPKMNQLASDYNNALYKLHLKYNALKDDSFGVMHTPTSIDFSGAPMKIYSDVDCFHPSADGHAFLAKATWNSFFKPQSQKVVRSKYNETEAIYCPNENDRLQM